MSIINSAAKLLPEPLRQFLLSDVLPELVIVIAFAVIQISLINL